MPKKDQKDKQGKHRTGRPAIVATERDIQQIEVMAGMGMTLDHIALVIGIGATTLDKWLKNKTVREAYERGRAKGAMQLTRTAFNKATAGDTTMLIFYLKTQLGWREKQPDEPTNTDGDGSKVVVVLPDNGRG